MSSTSSSGGLEGVVAGDTAISSLDTGLSYRGYAVEGLGAQSTFEETAFLLWHGELPTAAELAAFRQRLAAQLQLPPQLLDILRHVPASTPPMDVLRSCASLLAHFDADAADSSPPATLRKAERLLAQLPAALAAWHRLRGGHQPVPPKPELSLAANLLYMLHGREPAPDFARALEITLIMYAEHEFNASTFTARVVTSTLADMHSAVTAAIGALKGPLHGGANERVIELLAAVGSPERAATWLRQALADKSRIMGFGHRVYKQGDPRAVFLKPLCRQLAQAFSGPSLEPTAESLEQLMWAEKKIPPNLDWPSARIYYYLGLPVDLYTPLFVASRISGWCAHIREQQAHNRLIRPSAHYQGPAPRPYVPLAQRG